MRFSAIHKAASYLMIASAFAAVALSHELSLPLMAGTSLAALASYFIDPTRYPVLRSRPVLFAWNLATVLMALWSLSDAIAGQYLLAGVRFLCFILVNKLWNRFTSRDYLQAYVISFMMLVAASALNTDLVYAGCFLAYIVFATWTLTLFHLRREMEENYLLKHSDDAQSERVEVDRILNSRRIVGASFLAGTSLVSVGIFLSSALVFFLIPRFGFGFFMSQNRRGVATVGFSDRVDLGEYGRVKDNPQVVMRVELPQGPGDGALRMRGVSFDHYLHGHWSRSPAITPTPMKRWGEMWLVGGLSAGASMQRVRDIKTKARVQHVYLEPLDTSVLFGAVDPVAFQLPMRPAGGPPPMELEPRGADDIYAIERHVDREGRTYGVERKSGIRYTVYSIDSLPDTSVALRGAELSDGHRGDLAAYLQVPDDLPKRVTELAARVAQKHKTPFSRALALQNYLSTTYGYSLDGLERDARYEPIEDFLFSKKKGHCEYFASAMAVMLRTIGIPSRSVNGFLGGEWNEFGKYMAVRQGDAHAWVEAYIEGTGWVTFDPTPVGPARADAGSVISRMRRMLDTVELTWFKYVIEYDLKKQAEIFGGVKKSVQSFGKGRGILDKLREQKRNIAIGLVGIVALVFLWRQRRFALGGPRGVTRRRGRAEDALQRAIAALEKRGLAREPAETCRELAHRARDKADPKAPQFAELVEKYYAVRFGAVEIPAQDLDQLSRQVSADV